LWPDEEAKKYFFDKPLKHPSEDYKGGVMRSDYEMYGRFSGYFRKSMQVSKVSREQLTPDEEKKLALQDRYCLNWACRKVYK
jgi:hypothetical protein